MTTQKRKQTALRIPKTLDNELLKIADYMGFTKNALIVKACWELVEKIENSKKRS